MNKDNFIEVNGPTVVLHFNEIEPRFPGIIYSVQLPNGLVLTSPANFDLHSFVNCEPL